MLTGELRNKVDSLWEIFWTGGLTNPLDVIEQIRIGCRYTRNEPRKRILLGFVLRNFCNYFNCLEKYCKIN